MYTSKLSGFLGVIVMLVAIASAEPQDGGASVHIGPVRWTRDSVDDFQVPGAANAVFLTRRPDTSIVVVDPKTGAELQRLHGYIPGQSTYKCSPDGTVCLIGSGMLDGRVVTILYNTSDGQVTRVWNEQAEAWAISAKLQRACVLTKNGSVDGCALRNLTNGETLVWLDGWEYVWFDEWHGKLYVGTGRWGGETGNWTVEIDAVTGEVLSKWRIGLFGPMCRLRDSDTLLIIGQHPERPQLASVVGLNVTSGANGPIVECPSDVSDVCRCISHSISHAWSLHADGFQAMLYKARSLNVKSVLARRFSSGQLRKSECYVNDRVMLLGDPLPRVPEYVDDVNESYYYIPNTRWDGFICRAIGPTLGVADTDGMTQLSIAVDDSALRITTPRDIIGSAAISVMDVRGRLLKHVTVHVDERQVEVAIADLPAGNYVCSLESGTTRLSGKFTVLR